MKPTWVRLAWLLMLTGLLLGGCASPARVSAPQAGFWSGRLALQVEGSQNDSFAAAFELKGSAKDGALALFTPLGATIALLEWAPGSATLRSNGQTRQFDSADALAAHATGTAIPIAALFDWLAGINTAVPGWQADLSQLPQGRLRARRLQPAPAADLRIALEQP